MGFFKSDNSAEEMNFTPYKNLTATDTQTAIEQLTNIAVKNWSSTVTYSINEPCYYNGSFYKSKTNSNVNKDPSTETSDWESISSGEVGGLVNFTTENDIDQIDPSDRTVLLLHFNGDDYSIDFLDSSLYPKVVTPKNINVYQLNKITKVGNGILNLNNSYLTLYDHPDFELGNSDFTLETWIYPTNSYVDINERVLFSKNGYPNNSYYIALYYNYTNLSLISSFSTTGGYDLYSATDTIPFQNKNTWYHIAIVRNNGYIDRYVNGVKYGTSINIGSNSIYDGTSKLYIGGDNGSYKFSGYLDQIRISNIARYTSSFTPPTTTFENDSNTKLLLTCEGNHGSLPIDLSSGNHSVTPNSTFIYNVNEKFNGFGVFDTNYIFIAPSNDFNFKDENFTIDCWINLKSLPSSSNYSGIFSYRNDINVENSYSLSIYNNSGTYQLIFGYSYTGSNNNTLSSNYSFTPFTWYHIAVIRNGSNLNLYVNGISQANADIGANSLYIQANNNFLIGTMTPIYLDYNLKGFIDEFRIVKGSAKWTSDFTPPTAEY